MKTIERTLSQFGVDDLILVLCVTSQGGWLETSALEGNGIIFKKPEDVKEYAQGKNYVMIIDEFEYAEIEHTELYINAREYKGGRLVKATKDTIDKREQHVIAVKKAVNELES